MPNQALDESQENLRMEGRARREEAAAIVDETFLGIDTNDLIFSFFSFRCDNLLSQYHNPVLQ